MGFSPLFYGVITKIQGDTSYSDNLYMDFSDVIKNNGDIYNSDSLYKN